MPRPRIALIIVAAALTLGADQGSKLAARSTLADCSTSPCRAKTPLTLLENYLALEYHENPGMAFGIGRGWPGGRFILIGIGLLTLFVVWRLVRQVEQRQKLAAVAFGLVVGGAVGNLIDRIWLGRVIDFVVMHWQRKHQWPAYNVADVALVAGVLMLVLALGQKKDDSSARRKRRAA